MNHLEQINLEKDYYEVAEPHPIGQGAFGVFWKLRQLSDGREVALKTVQRRAIPQQHPLYSRNH